MGVPACRRGIAATRQCPSAAASCTCPLAGVSYPAPGAKWHAFTLQDGWKSAQAKEHTAAPSSTIINGVVYLNGSIYEATKINGRWAFLPAGVKTKADVLNFEVLTSGGNPGAIAITDDMGIAGSLPFSNAQAFTSLAGVAYPQSS